MLAKQACHTFEIELNYFFHRSNAVLKFNHKLLHAEETLARAKKALYFTTLGAALHLKHSEDYRPSTSLSSVMLKIEGYPSCHSFLNKFWAKTSGLRGSSAYVSIEDSPSYFLCQTENRLALLKHIHKLAHALHGTKVALSPIEVNWRWDITRTRSNRLPHHYQSYDFVMNVDCATEFDADTWLCNALSKVCPSMDPRADMYAIDTIEKKLGHSYCRSMEKTTRGMVLQFDDLVTAQLIVEALYEDCAPNYEFDDKLGRTVVTLTYPDLHKTATRIEELEAMC